MESMERTFQIRVPSSTENLAMIRDFVGKIGERIGARLAALIRLGLETPESEYWAALARIEKMRARVFEEHDFFLSPAATGPAPAGFESTGSPAMNAGWTALGAPAISIPTRVFPPLGIQIAAAPGNDAALLAYAVQLEATM